MIARLNLPPVWLIGFMALAWGIAQIHAPWGDTAARFGWMMIGAAVALMLWAALAFARARTTIVPHQDPSALVATGPYRISRNPIYVADLVILAGWCLVVGAPLALVLLGPFYVVLNRLFVLPEEARLAAHFGTAYDDYRARVRRWI